MTDFRHIAVAYDFSPHARAALEHATALSRRLRSNLHLVHVVQIPTPGVVPIGAMVAVPPVDLSEAREEALASLQDVVDGIPSLPGKAVAHVVEGMDVAACLCAAAEELDVDLLAAGTRGHTGLAHVLLGSTAERILRQAPCPVLVVRDSSQREESARDDDECEEDER